MRLLDTIKSLNPLRKLAPSLSARVTTAFLEHQTLAEVMRDASDQVAKRAVRRALEEFTDGPAALLITCLLESTTAQWQQLASEVKSSSRLPRDGASWAATRIGDYGRSLGSDVMTQHLINLVLSVTGLHVEALVLTRADVDARRLTEKLAELLRQGLSSGLSRTDLAQTLATAPRTMGRLASAS